MRILVCCTQESKPSLVEETKASEAGPTASDKALAAKSDGKANNKSPKKPKVVAELEPAQAAAADKEGTSGSEEEDEDDEEEPRRMFPSACAKSNLFGRAARCCCASCLQCESADALQLACWSSLC